MFDFEAPCYEPHRWYRGGHLQTLASVRSSKVVSPTSTKHEVTLPDGDAIVLHETPRSRWCCVWTRFTVAGDRKVAVADSRVERLPWVAVHDSHGPAVFPTGLQRVSRRHARLWGRRRVGA